MRASLRSLLLVSSMLGGLCACKQDAPPAPTSAAPAPAPQVAAPPAPAPAPDAPVNPPQTIVGGVAVTGPHRSAEGVAGAIQGNGTAVTAQTPLAVGNIVQVLWNGVHYQAQVLALNGDGTVRVHYVGWSNNWDENVARDRLKVGPIVALTNAPAPAPQAAAAPPPNAQPAVGTGTAIDANTPLAAGQAIIVEWSGRWYPGSVIRTNPDGTVRIHYVGWADSWDEDAPRARIRLP